VRTATGFDAWVGPRRPRNSRQLNRTRASGRQSPRQPSPNFLRGDLHSTSIWALFSPAIRTRLADWESVTFSGLAANEIVIFVIDGVVRLEPSQASVFYANLLQPQNVKLEIPVEDMRLPAWKLWSFPDSPFSQLASTEPGSACQ